MHCSPHLPAPARKDHLSLSLVLILNFIHFCGTKCILVRYNIIKRLLDETVPIYTNVFTLHSLQVNNLAKS